MTVLGLHLASKYTGYAILTGGKETVLAHYGSLLLGHRDSIQDKLRQFYTLVEELVTTHGVTTIAIETPLSTRSRTNFDKINNIMGVLYLLCAEYEVKLDELYLTEIHKTISGSDRSSNERTIRILRSQFPTLRDKQITTITSAIATGVTSIWKKR